MNLTWNIVRKDLRRMAPSVGLWAAFILATSLGIQALRMPTGGERVIWFADWSMWCVVGAVVEFGAVFVLTGAIVLEDAVVGTTSFWMTRPIANGRLFGAKLVSIVTLLLVAPLVVLSAGWMATGAGLDEIWRVVRDFLLIDSIIIVAALAFSAVARSYGQFLLGAFIGGAVWTGATAGMDLVHRPHGMMLDAHPNPIMWRIAPVVLAVMAAQQFLTRRSRWTWATFAVGLVVAGIAKQISPWESDFRATRHSAWEPIPVTKLASHPGADSSIAWFYFEGAAQPRSGVYRVPAFAYDPSGKHPVDGFTLADRDFVAAVALGGSTRPVEWRLVSPGARNSSIREPELKGLEATYATVRVLGEMAMVAGAEIRAGASRVRIVAVERDTHGDATLVLEQHDVRPRADAGSERRRRDYFVFVDRASHASRVLEGPSLGTLALNGFVLTGFDLGVPDEVGMESGRIVQVRLESDAAVIFSSFGEQEKASR